MEKRTKQVLLRLTPTVYRRLSAVSAATGRTIPELARGYLARGLETDERRAQRVKDQS